VGASFLENSRLPSRSARDLDRINRIYSGRRIKSKKVLLI
jgi:type IV secretory pathway VirJ component